MKGILRWTFALIGPAVLAIIIFGLYAVGACVSAARVAERLRSDINTRGLKVETLKALAPIFERRNDSSEYRSAMKLAELGEIVARNEFEAFTERLENKRFLAQAKFDPDYLAQLKSAASNPDPSANEIIKSMRERTVALLTPRPGDREQKVYLFLRENIPGIRPFLPELPAVPQTTE